MENIPEQTFKKTYEVSSDRVDFKERYDLRHLMNDFHDIAGKQSTIYGIDADMIGEKYGAMWIITRVRIAFTGSMPKWKDTVSAETYPLAPGIVRMEREAVFRRESGEIFAMLGSEWCVLDRATGRPRRPTQVGYPVEYPHKQRAVMIDYTPMRLTTDENDFVFSHVARVSDLDLNRHFNNVAYITLGLDAFSSGELSSDMLRYDIAFKSQCYEGEELRVYRRKTEDGRGWYVYCDKQDGTRVFDSLICFKQDV